MTAHAGGDRGRLLVLFVTAFVDMVGITMLVPLLPYYAQEFGASATVIGAIISSFSVRHICAGSCDLTHAITTAHLNTHLSMLLKRRDFADWDAIPRGILGSRARSTID